MKLEIQEKKLQIPLKTFKENEKNINKEKCKILKTDNLKKKKKKKLIELQINTFTNITSCVSLIHYDGSEFNLD